MGNTARVPLHGNPSKYTTIELGATRGAVVGVNLYWPDGRVVQESDFGGTRVIVQGSSAGGGSSNPVSVTIWSLIQQIPLNIQEAAALTGNGLIVRQAAGDWIVRSIDVTTGELVIANADGDTGNPTIGLAPVTDAGGGVLLKIVRDGFGRVTGTSAASNADFVQRIPMEAGADVSALHVIVTTGGLGLVQHANPALVSHATRVLGVSITAATTGNTVYIQASGEMVDGSFGWASNSPIYLQSSGSLNNIIPASGFVLQVGVALGANRMLIDLRTPIIRI